MSKKIQITAGAFIFSIVLLSVYHYHHANQTVLAYNQKNLIRLHVVANSNNEVDQVLKMKVRDAILQSMSPVFREIDNTGEARTFLQANLDEIKNIAANKIKAEGRNYPVKVSLGYFPFPTKTYGQLTLPAGEYEALQVIIGQGAGANWWCVLFPPLCFVSLTQEKVDLGKNNEALAASTENLGIDNKTCQNKAYQIKFKFKSWELLKQSSPRLAKAIENYLKN